MRATADVVVIGGGVVGCSILFNLARLGVTDAILLERRMLNAGSTGRSQAICRMHYSNPVTALLAWESMGIFRHFPEITGGPSGYTETGYLVVVKEDDRPGLERNVAMQFGLGLDVMAVTAADLRDLAPMVAVSEDEALGWEPQSGYADPYLVTSSYAAAAQSLGAAVELDCPAQRIEVDGGRVRAVHTAAGRIETAAAVVAAGPWARALLSPLGADLPLSTVRHQVASLVRPVERLPLHPAVGDIAQNFSFRPDGDRMTLMGFGDDEEAAVEDYDERITMAQMAEARQKLVRRMPAMAASYFRGGWSGLFTITPDWHPVLDAVPGIEGLYCAVGFSGHGFKLSPMIGVTMAELITQGRAASVDITPLRYTRFAENALMESSYRYRVLA